MNLKPLCLIAGLLGLPTAYANAVEITINVPVEITNGPTDRPVLVVCYVGTGMLDGSNGSSSPAGSSQVPRGPVAKTYDFKGNVSVRLKASPELDRATHYRCEMVQMLGDRRQQVATPNPSVTGTIPR